MNPNHTQRSTQSGPLRVAFAVSGGIATVLAVSLLAVAGLVLWASTRTDDHDYATSATHELGTSSAALTSENLDIDLDGLGWLIGSDDTGRVRVNVEPTGGKPVFVGVARTRDVQRYLGDVAHTTVTDLDDVLFSADYRHHRGAARAARPASQDIWVASRTGSGKQTLSWDVSDGDWSVVVMNADGTSRVRADVSAGVKIPYLSTIGWTAGGAGALLGVLAGGLFVLAARPVRDRRAGETTAPRRPVASPSGGPTA